MPDKVKKMFDQYGGVMSTAELQDHGFYYRGGRKIMEQGQVEQIRRGFYRYVGDKNISEAAVIHKLFPDGVLCLDSALAYYEYTAKNHRLGIWQLLTKAPGSVSISPGRR